MYINKLMGLCVCAGVCVCAVTTAFAVSYFCTNMILQNLVYVDAPVLKSNLIDK